MAYRTFLVPVSCVPINHSLIALWVLEVPRNLETGLEAHYSYKRERWRTALDVLRSPSDKELNVRRLRAIRRLIAPPHLQELFCRE